MECYNKLNPAGCPVWIHIDKIIANDYNPNQVAPKELELLYISIKEDGYTMPIVVCKDKNNYVIVDGFHRYLIMKKYTDIYQRTNGYLPCAILNKTLEERMESTIRHNRARGAHITNKEAGMLLYLRNSGLSPEEIEYKLGMSHDEYLRKTMLYRIEDIVKNYKYSEAKALFD